MKCTLFTPPLMAIALLTYSAQAITMDDLEELIGEALEKGKIDLYMQEVKGFDESNYPYYEGTNGCGGEELTAYIVPDKYVYRETIKVLGKKKTITLLEANFRDACNKHDECYMTYEKSKEYCDGKFTQDLGTACYNGELKNFSDIIKNIITGFAPAGVCLGVAVNYSTVTAVAGHAFYPNAHEKAEKYKNDLNDMFSTEPDKQNTWYECRSVPFDEYRNNEIKYTHVTTCKKNLNF